MNIKPAPGQFAAAGQRKRVAIVGSGISGASAAWSLSSVHDVTLFEAGDRPGGHTCTVDVDHDGTHIPVDVGFIVFNERNYPDLCALFDHLDIARETTNMSFSMSLDSGRREWCGQDYLTVFAQKRNLVSPGFLWMLREIFRFNKQARIDRDEGLLNRLSIGDYLDMQRFSQRFRDDYLIPMAAAIWSTPRIKMLDFPARSFVQFFENHRLLETRPPVWQTVSGGSRSYLDKLLAPLGDAVRTNAPVTRIERPANGGAVVHTQCGAAAHFDAVILASHCDQTLAMLADADANEADILSAIPYKPNRVILHRDPSFMPKRPGAWAAWNYLRESGQGDDSEVCVTYWMNRLQNIDPRHPLFVTLNPTREPAAGTVFGEWSFDHPQYDTAAFAAQARLPLIQGRRDTWFAGAWTGYGFHEDGLRSGLDAAEALGAIVPWRATGGPAVEELPLPIAAE